ncbi:hypothetical protein M3Y94_00035300 [Aphelenchoides besseyi]|nr:hypothetical protein M3Y94_00035300 [Aphelenchoides besseyi]KAI6218577.1 GST protein [Aphelenchoides besseyi]
MVQYKLHYFNSRGLAEPARLIFAFKGIEFEDVRYEHANFDKSKWPFGKLPVLEVDGKQLPESFAIFRFLAKQTQLAGGNDFESAEIDAIGYLWKDFVGDLRTYFRVVTGQIEGDKDKLRKDFDLALEKYVPILESKLKESDNGYFHKSGICWVDFVVANFYWKCLKSMPDDFGKSKLLAEHCERIHSLPNVKEYVAKRPDTEY